MKNFILFILLFWLNVAFVIFMKTNVIKFIILIIFTSFFLNSCGFYKRSDIKSVEKRPIFFSFNGGPGAASIWMHMGYTSPRILNIDDEGNPVQPYGFKENPKSQIFFRVGKHKQWGKKLNKKQIKSIETKFSKIMKELDYI